MMTRGAATGDKTDAKGRGVLMMLERWQARERTKLRPIEAKSTWVFGVWRALVGVPVGGAGAPVRQVFAGRNASALISPECPPAVPNRATSPPWALGVSL